MMKGSDASAGPKKILLYRPAGSNGAAAKATVGELTVTALYEGIRGNDITVMIQEQVDTEGTYDVTTLIDGRAVDTQSIGDLSQLSANEWVTFSGTGTSFQETAGTALTGGKDLEVSSSDYADFLTAVEPYRFDVLVYDGTDATTIAAIASFVERLSDNVGQKCQAVMAGENAVSCDSEFVIAVKNGVLLDDGTKLIAQQATWWVGGRRGGSSLQSVAYICAVPRGRGGKSQADGHAGG